MINNDTIAIIRSVRRFNRLYSELLDTLEGALSPELSRAEMQVLFLLAHAPDSTAKTIAAQLRLDTGYLSRLLSSMVSQQWITRTKAAHDARHQPMRLTPKGRALFQQIDAAANANVSAMLKQLPATRQQKLARAMREVAHLLDQRGEATPPFIFRPPRAGDLGWIIHRHGTVIAEEFGWDEKFEAMVADIIAEFSKNYDPKSDRAIIAEHDGDVVGSVFLVREDTTTAKLRLLYVEPSMRGLGLGKKLVERAVRDARKIGYRRVTLWTNRGLDSARKIYESAGFQLIEETPHSEFTSSKLDTLGQTWELMLTEKAV